MINHKITKLVVAFAIGIALSLWSYQMITDPEPAMERSLEEAAVLAARKIVGDFIGLTDESEIVDPLAPNRVAGKTYIYPVASGWQVSGHYRRNLSDRWHPFLMSLDGGLQVQQLSVQDTDPELGKRAEADPRLDVTS
jgi:hypothetical protein